MRDLEFIRRSPGIAPASGGLRGSPGISGEVESGAAGRRPPSHAPWPG